MSEAFRWAFIGSGRLAGEVAREITASGRHQVVSVYTRRPEKCAAFAAEYGAVAASSAAEAVSRPDVDGVYVVTPHTSHVPYAMEALRAGKPVLCEKPVSTDALQTETLIRFSEERGLYFSEAMWTWFSPIANRVKAWLDAGEFGEILDCGASYRGQGKYYAPRVTDPLVGGGALLDIGIYPVTYFYRLFGKPQSVDCEGVLRDGIDVSEEIRMSFPGGKTCRLSVSIDADCEDEKLFIRGTKASVVIPAFHYANSVTLERAEGGPETFNAYGGMLNEFDLVSSEIRAGKTESAFVPHSATLEVMRILDGCRRQLGLVYPFEKA